jgi:peptidoglycan-N-acetylglucosamine deacetylase
VLTFDDGPWPGNTPAVLKALAEQCTKAVFFPIGKHAMWHPEVLKQVAAAGHTVGSHTWSHADLSKVTPDQAKEEIEKGVSAVRVALGQPEASFFRFPALRHSPELLAYLGTRNIGIFSTDMDSFDFKMRKPEQVVESVMSKLKKHGEYFIELERNVYSWRIAAIVHPLRKSVLPAAAFFYPSQAAAEQCARAAIDDHLNGGLMD